MILILSARLHRLDRVAGVDRPLERIRRDDLGDVRELHDVEQRGDAGHDVLRRGGRGGDDGLVAGRQGHEQRGQRLGQLVRLRGIVRCQHLLDAVERGGLLGRLVDALAGHQHMDRRAEGRGGGQGLRGDVGEGAGLDFGEE